MAMSAPQSAPKRARLGEVPQSTLKAPERNWKFQVVLLVDVSGSMKKMDAVGPDGGKISRFRAVFNALDVALQSLAGMDDLVCSLVLFSDKHDVRLTHQTIDVSLRTQLGQIQASLRGIFSSGTSYLEALRGMHALSAGSIDVGVLFSDGEPTDPDPPAVLNFVRQMRLQFGPRFILHTVGFGMFDTDCLESLARIGGGTFHENSSLDTTVLRNIFLTLTKTVTTLRSTVLAFGMQALKPLPQRPKEPEDFWRKASPAELLQASEERVAWLMLQDRNAADATASAGNQPAGDGKDVKLVAAGKPQKGRLHLKPFAEGALRYAFHFFTLAATAERRLHLVVKEGKYGGAHGSPQQAHHAFLVNHRRAEALAAEFNKSVAERFPREGESIDYAVKFVPAFVIKLSDGSTESGFRYSIAERFIEGAYEKMNGNDGYVNPGVALHTARVAAAFSHFTFEHTDGMELCVDIQGVGREWTDPQLHSRARSYGAADLGEEGMRRFFRSHQCSQLCRAIRLHGVHPDSLKLDRSQDLGTPLRL